MGTVLVTGATSGLGREFCWQLAAANHKLVMVARNEDRLQELGAEIHNVAGVRVETIAADIAEPEQLAAVCVRLAEGREDGVPPIDFLINNAGFGLEKPFLDNDLDEELYGLEVMVRAVMATSYYAGRAMRERGHGAILNVSSVAADTAMGPYSAHKAWVRTFSEGLAQELRGTGVTVTAVTPGLVHTEFHQRMGDDFSQFPEFLWARPERVVTEALAAVRRGQVLVTPTPLYKAVNGLARVLPRSVVRAVSGRLAQM